MMRAGSRDNSAAGAHRRSLNQTGYKGWSAIHESALVFHPPARAPGYRPGDVRLYRGPPAQSCARDLFACSRAKRAELRNGVLAHLAGYDPALWLGRDPFLAGAVDALQQARMEIAANRDSPPGRGVQ